VFRFHGEDTGDAFHVTQVGLHDRFDGLAMGLFEGRELDCAGQFFGHASILTRLRV
jgi:hypothetical protein